jgi:hypothetical protein
MTPNIRKEVILPLQQLRVSQGRIVILRFLRRALIGCTEPGAVGRFEKSKPGSRDFRLLIHPPKGDRKGNGALETLNILYIVAGAKLG